MNLTTKSILVPALAALFNLGIETAGAHALAGLPHPHPHVGALDAPEGALALALILGLMTAWTLRALLRRSGRFEGSNVLARANLRR